MLMKMKPTVQITRFPGGVRVSLGGKVTLRCVFSRWKGDVEEGVRVGLYFFFGCEYTPALRCTRTCGSRLYSHSRLAPTVALSQPDSEFRLVTKVGLVSDESDVGSADTDWSGFPLML